MEYQLTITSAERDLLMDLLESERSELAPVIKHTGSGPGVREAVKDRQHMAEAILERLRSCAAPDRGDAC